MPRKEADNAEEEVDDESAEEGQEAEQEPEEEGEGEDEGQDDSEAKRKVKAANDEAKKHRLRAKALAQKLADAEKRNAELKDKLGTAETTLRAKQGDLQDEVKELKLRLAFNDLCPELSINTYREDAWDTVAGDLQSAIGDDDTVDDEKLRTIVQSAIHEHPWIVTAEEGGEEDKPRRPKSPTLSGNRQRTAQPRDTVDALAKKYPALLQKH